MYIKYSILHAGFPVIPNPTRTQDFFGHFFESLCRETSLYYSETMTNFSVNQHPFLVPEIFKNPIDVEIFMSNPLHYNQDPVFPHDQSWDCLSLASGHPGILLLFSVLQQKGLLDQNDDVAHRYVLRIKEIIEKKGLPRNLSLFSGVSGICFAIQMASMGGTRYQRMLHTLQTSLLNQIDTTYLQAIRENIKNNCSSISSLYDLIQGLSGIGLYCLSNLSELRFREMTEMICKSLIALAQPLTVKEQKVPGWFVSPLDPLNIEPNAALEGNFNLGLAHGIPGILSFLSVASLRGIQVKGQEEAILTIGKWIKEKSCLNDNRIEWPYTVSWEEETQHKYPRDRKKARDAWCYGAPGIARSLFLAAKATSDEDLKLLSVRALHDIFACSFENWDLPGPALCHGIAGLLLITNAMAKEMRDEKLLSHVDRLKKILLADYDPEHPFGFKDIEPCSSGKTAAVSKPGLLEGSSGIFLTLMTINDVKPSWHLPFLAHD